MKGVPVGGSGRQREALCKLARCEARSCRGSRPIKSIDAPAPTPANSADTTPTGKVPMRVVAHRCVAIAQRGAGGLWTFVGCRDIESAQLAEPSANLPTNPEWGAYQVVHVDAELVRLEVHLLARHVVLAAQAHPLAVLLQ